MSTHPSATKHSTCFFLDTLPPELRLTIYEYFLLADEPVRGHSARKGRKYGLHMTILRVNRQIHNEAKSLFFGKNTFYITSIPDAQLENPATNKAGSGRDEEKVKKDSEGSVQRFDPPLQDKDLPLLRHLTLDLLYYPQELLSESGPNGSGWKPVDPGASAYITSLTHLLTQVSSKLQTLRLTAEVSESFCAKRCLITFFMADRDRNFALSLSALAAIKNISVSFEFADCFYRIVVEPGTFIKRSILLLACQVMFWQSKVRIEELMRAFEEGGDVEGIVEGKKMKERIDLAPFVGKVWPMQESGKALLGIE